MEKYNPQAVESKWQAVWNAPDYYRTTEDSSKPKYYALEMFPYPSGNLHMGHVRNYSIGDVVARYRSMAGYNVLHPMGFDAFGMPAENAAIAHGVKPGDWTFANIKNMTAQQKAMGLAKIITAGRSGCSSCSISAGLPIKKKPPLTGATSAAPSLPMNRSLTANVGVAIPKSTKKIWRSGSSR